jgi:signal transduction histidine kinase
MVEVKSGRIIVVDRDASRRAERARVLRDAGHTVYEAGYLSDATMLRQTRPELLVLGLNGIGSENDSGELTAARDEDDDDASSTMVLRISPDHDGHVHDAHVHDDDHDGLDLGRATLDGDAYLVEPVPPDVLVATAHALLRLRRAESALRDTIALEHSARVEADAANRIKDDFLGTLSHELRTPLHAIVGWVALLRTRPFDDEARGRALEIIERNARTEASLIEDLLDVSRITLGQLRLTWRPVELLPILNTVLDGIARTAEAKGVTISTKLALDPDIAVRGDATRLRQVFWNLLSNAVKFTPPGGRVDVRAHAKDGRAVIAVADTGRGISPEFMPHMFERFGRGDHGTTSPDRGLGLGLALAHELIELHAGELTVSSPGVNQGATFVVSLPALATQGRAAIPRKASSLL